MASTLYHVTKTSSVKSILKKGIQPLHTSNWVTGFGKRYGEGEIFAFEHIADAMRWSSHMDWELHKDLGTGKISIVEFINDGEWEADESDPISQLGRKGNWLKRFRPVPAANIVASKPFTKAMVKKVVAGNPEDELPDLFDKLGPNMKGVISSGKVTAWHIDSRGTPYHLAVANLLGYDPLASVQLTFEDKVDGNDYHLVILSISLEVVKLYEDERATAVAREIIENNVEGLSGGDAVEVHYNTSGGWKLWSGKAAQISDRVTSGNPPPHMISREYGGGPDPSNEDPRDRVTISIEQPEDITSEAVQDTKLDLFFAKIGKFARGTPSIYKAFGLPSPNFVYPDPRTSELARHDPDVVVAMMFGITADPRLTSNLKEHAEELSEIMAELIKAALEEAKLHGAYGVFARGGFPEKHRMLIKNGFTESDFADDGGYRIYVKILGQPGQATNPPEAQIERKKTRFLTSYSVMEDLFTEASEGIISVYYEKLGHSVHGLKKFVQDLYGSDASTKGAMEAYLQIKNKYESIHAEHFELLLRVLQLAVKDARESGAYMIYTSGPKNDKLPSDRELVDLLEAAGFKKTKQSVWNIGEGIYIINFREQASNPPPITITREAIGNEINPNLDPERCIKFAQEEDLFYSSSKHNYAKIYFRRIVESLQNVPRLFEAFGQSSEIELQDPHQMVAFISSPTIYSLAPEVASALVQAALGEAKSRGVVGVYITIPLDTSGVWTKNGFKRTRIRSANDDAVYVKLFDRTRA